MKKFPLIWICLLFAIMRFGSAQDTRAPFFVSNGLFDQSQPETLGLSFAPKIETFTVFRPGANSNHYNHGVVLIPFKGELYAQWQTSATDEDSPDTHVIYSRSTNGKDWTTPEVLSPKIDGGIVTSGGWWVYHDTLIAYLCVWPNNPAGPKQGHTVYLTSTDGLEWSAPKPVLDDQGQPVKGIIEQDLHALPNDRIITAFHMQPGLICSPFYTDDPSGLTGWVKGNMQNLPYKDEMSRELEPSWFYRKDGAVIMVFRDQVSSYKKLASISKDEGENWSKPVLVDMADSRAKQSAGNLPDGTAFQVSNPVNNKQRFPLVVTLSKDGKLFDRAFLLRSGGHDLQRLRYEGKYKRQGYSYPKSVIWGDYLYVGYATNKEDVEVTRVPWKELLD